MNDSSAIALPGKAHPATGEPEAEQVWQKPVAWLLAALKTTQAGLKTGASRSPGGGRGAP